MSSQPVADIVDSSQQQKQQETNGSPNVPLVPIEGVTKQYAVVDSTNSIPGANTSIGTPLQKAIHAAAALASVGQGDSSVTPPPPTLPTVPLLPPSMHSSDTKPPTLKPKIVVAMQEQSQPFVMSVQHQAPAPYPQPSAGVPLHFGLPNGVSVPMPAMGHIPPGAYHQMAEAAKVASTPALFRGRPLRSGKWTREEETYADLLVELFEKGHIDEKNGSTLRSFLSRKLHCSPMRISKKYAGKGIGKMVFLSKNDYCGVGGAIGSPSYHANMRRLREAESNFYKACFPELAMQSYQGYGMPLDTSALAPPPTQSFQYMASVQPNMPAMFTQLVSQIHPQQNGPLLTQNMLQPQHGIATYWLPVAASANHASAPVGQVIAVGADGSAPSGGSGSKVPSDAYQSLEQAYLAVAHQQGLRQADPNVSLSNGTGLVVDSKAQQIPTAATGMHAGAAGNEVQPYHQEATTDSQGEQQIQGTLNSLPDFVSAFDRVTGQKSSTHAEPSPGHHSPTQTTPSFDDFHRLLGQNLSPLPRQANGKYNGEVRVATTQHAPAQGPAGFVAGAPIAFVSIPGAGMVQHPPALSLAPEPNHQSMLGRAYGEALSAVSKRVSRSPSTLGADSYNLFAQQSAFEASQHSAYSPPHTNSVMGGYLWQDNQYGATQKRGAPSVPTGHSASSSPGAATSLTSYVNSAVVSEPSNESDQGAEESDESPGDSSRGVEMDSLNFDVSSATSEESNSKPSRKRAKIAQHHLTTTNSPAYSLNLFS